MIRNKRPGFSVRDTFVVHPSRDLLFNGIRYKRNTIFPWKETVCTARRLGLMFGARKILSEFEIDGKPKKTVILKDEELTEEKNEELTEVVESEKTDKKELTQEDETPKKKGRRRRNKDKNDNKDKNKTDKKRSRRKLTKPRS